MTPSQTQDILDEYQKEYERVTGAKPRIWEKVRYVVVTDKYPELEMSFKELRQALARMKERPSHVTPNPNQVK